MPPNLRKTPSGYQYRRVVPADLRPYLGKREIKRSLGRDFRRARELHAQMEVETNSAFTAAWSSVEPNRAVDLQTFLAKPLRSRNKKIDAAEPRLGERLGAMWITTTLEFDLARRRDGTLDDDEYQAIDDMVKDIGPRINRALATGSVAAFYPVVSELC